MNNSKNFLSASTITYPCSNPVTVAYSAISSTPMYMGYFRDNLAKSSTFLVCVAENNIVYLSYGSI